MKYIKLLILMMLIISLSGCGTITKENNGKKVVKVALSAEVNPPYLYTDSDNKPVGYDMDYMKELEKKLPQYDFQYEFGEEESNVVGIGVGKFDMGINWFFKTPEREQKFLYQKEPYVYSLTTLIVHNDTNDIETLDDLQHKSLTPMSPSGGLYSILTGYNKTHKNQIDIDEIHKVSNGENFKMIESKRRDAMFLNLTTYQAIQKELNADVKVGGVVSKESVHILYNNKNTQLQKDIDKATKELKEDGTLEELSKKWFGFNIFDDKESLNDIKDRL
ncbi:MULTISPECIES: transporter substrate-binding domain-containing protein [Mammaliicoccus]|jgi:L-cystine transport system substrate-binding protein|uniref:Transporter substrate-binding domain-containing protein n=1 Tax=Mammaliicoccus sciuri TaxID=1296 RepID=A0AAW5LK38_MAMSC|nr:MULTISPECIES: transporter substrate-binding domain-containing protein [Mammaliicoccus]MBF0772729.1 transporter substrate-binding domain-containing protein [Mammaliicoccus sciuri]MBG9205759.1 transporter substrate-binding domain-containing protein [Mammaliicoccus sciuri]MBG9209297.1 transporter substrate-binding domain-containing protein [Mammaliicoccus sciuri]MBO1209388.1 transporter substrate-binding domain-containing protein [Mammaliicoccus sciuri]MCD3218659.1 transporter substrate-bindin